MDEDILAILTANEAITFRGIEPLDGADITLRHTTFSYRNEIRPDVRLACTGDLGHWRYLITTVGRCQGQLAAVTWLQQSQRILNANAAKRSWEIRRFAIGKFGAGTPVRPSACAKTAVRRQARPSAGITN
ncbi:hypothetical protein DIM_08750 [Candidatus Denitrolinea symbiosum]|nr:hypothetical protein DIM_08750 [Candidatus Denitrolinea symbiosum]